MRSTWAQGPKPASNSDAVQEYQWNRSSDGREHLAFLEDRMRTDSAAPLLLSQEETAVLYSKLYDSTPWVWDHSKFNGNIAGGRLGLCCDNAGNDGWHKLPLSFMKHSLLKKTFSFSSWGLAWVAAYILLLRRMVWQRRPVVRPASHLCIAHEFWTSAHRWQAWVLSLQLLGFCHQRPS